MKDNPSIYQELDRTSSVIVGGLRDQLARHKLPFTINQVGSMFTLFFTSQVVTDYDSAKTSDTAMFGRYFNAMLRRGVYLAPSQFEAMFVSHAVTMEIADRILLASDEALGELA